MIGQKFGSQWLRHNEDLRIWEVRAVKHERAADYNVAGVTKPRISKMLNVQESQNMAALTL